MRRYHRAALVTIFPAFRSSSCIQSPERPDRPLRWNEKIIGQHKTHDIVGASVRCGAVRCGSSTAATATVVAVAVVVAEEAAAAVAAVVAETRQERRRSALEYSR